MKISHIRIYGCVVAPQLLPKYIRNRLVLREIVYHPIWGVKLTS
jgi:hypothetical protein